MEETICTLLELLLFKDLHLVSFFGLNHHHRLSYFFRTAHGDVCAKPLEFYSDSVLFFELPPYPLPNGVGVTPDTELHASVLLTNDGRTFSNVLEFTYVSGTHFVKESVINFRCFAPSNNQLKSFL